MMRFITKNRALFLKAAIMLFWIMVWQIIAVIVNRELFIPTPMTTLRALRTLVFEGDFWRIVIMSIYRVFLGFLTAILLGGITGVVCGLNGLFYQLFHPLVIAIKSTPVLSFIIIALLWFGSENVPVFICFLMCYPIIWISFVEGIHQVDRDLLQMAKLFQVKKGYIIKNIYLPASTPYVITGILSGLGLGWKVTIAAEVLSHPRYSIGGMLYDAKIYLESELVFAWTIVVIVLSMLFEFIFNKSLNHFSNKSLKRMTGRGDDL